MRRWLLVTLLFMSGLRTGFTLDKTLIEQKIYELVNKERSKKGLKAYKYHTSLQKIARYHSKNMVKHDFFSHTDQNGESSSQRALNHAPELMGGVGENIAYHYGSTEEEAAKNLMEAWMNSSGHRANILSSRYNYIGVGVAFKGNRIYATQNFGDLTAELIHISSTEFIYDNVVKMRFKFLGNFPRSKINIFVHFPQKNARFYMPNGVYYTGMGKYEPRWIQEKTFEIDVHLKYGRGRYQLKIGKSPYVYDAFSFLVK